jgi:hypothetical protein
MAAHYTYFSFPSADNLLNYNESQFPNLHTHNAFQRIVTETLCITTDINNPGHTLPCLNSSGLGSRACS